MKRGLEEMSVETSGKKTKTVGNGEGSAEVHGEQWTRVEKKKKKIRKSESKMDNAHPRFMYSNTEIVKRHYAIAIDDIRDLILHILADAPPPNWLRIDNVNMIQKVVALLIPGISPEILSLPPFPTSATANPNLPLSIPLLPPTLQAASTAADIPFIATTFSHACPTRAPGDQTRMHSVLSSFFTGPISGEEKKRRLEQKLQQCVIKNDPTSYLLTLEQMIENDYPIPSYMADVFEKPPEWVETPEPKGTTEYKLGHPKVYAIDCEMCVTENGKELTRVCVIDFDSGIVVFDQLVKPSKPILDYLTRWSGITAEALSSVTTTLSQVQANILRLLSPSSLKPNPFSSPSKSASQPPPPASSTPILLGHSLESDLKALKICHPRCIDTALMYHHPRGRPLKPGLKWLTEKWCGRKIQTRGEGGHDPEEDARACLDLLKKKLEEGPGFGEFKTDYESIFERMGRATWRGGGGTIKSAVVDHGNPGVMHGSKADTALACKTDDEVLEGLLNVIPSHQFTFGRFMALSSTLGWITSKVTPDSLIQTQSSPATTTTTATQDPSVATTPDVLIGPILSDLNTQLKSLQESLPPRTALIIFTGHADPRRMSALNMRKSAFDTGYKSGKTPEELTKEGITWSMSDGRELEQEVELAKRGLLFLGVKHVVAQWKYPTPQSHLMMIGQAQDQEVKKNPDVNFK